MLVPFMIGFIDKKCSFNFYVLINHTSNVTKLMNNLFVTTKKKH